MKYIKKHKVAFVLWTIFELFYVPCVIFIAEFINNVVDLSLEGDFNGVLVNVKLFIVIFGSYFFIDILAKYFKRKFMYQTQIDMEKDILKGIIDGNGEEYNDGALISIINNDVPTVLDQYYRYIPYIFRNLFLSLGSIAFLFHYNIPLAIIVIILTGIPMVIMNLGLKSYQDKRKIFLQKRDTFIDKVKEMFAGYLTILTHNKIELFRNESYSALHEYTEEKKNFNFNLDNFINKIITLTYAMILVQYACFAVFKLKGWVTMGVIMAFIQLSASTVNPLFEIYDYYGTIKSHRETLNRINSLTKKVDIVEGIKPKEIFPIKIDIRSLKIDDTLIFENLQLIFEKGKKYMLTGPSGCGKTTLFRVLTKEITNFEGSVTLGGFEIEDIDSNYLKSKIAYIEQRPYLFQMTIRDNITMLKNTDENKLKEILSNDYIQEIIESKTEEYWVEENGKNLSGGEKMRIALSRLFLKNCELILSDEVTANLDKTNARLVEEALLNSGKTLISISHNNLDEIQGYDTIVRMTFNEEENEQLKQLTT